MKGAPINAVKISLLIWHTEMRKLVELDFRNLHCI
jgi:hypothetical protein